MKNHWKYLFRTFLILIIDLSNLKTYEEASRSAVALHLLLSSMKNSWGLKSLGHSHSRQPTAYFLYWIRKFLFIRKGWNSIFFQYFTSWDFFVYSCIELYQWRRKTGVKDAPNQPCPTSSPKNFSNVTLKV